MKMQIGRWGNSLAVRLPKELVDRFGLKEGGEIESEAIERAFEAAQEDDRQRRRQAALEEIDRQQFPLPDDYKFDRDEANWRPALDRW